MSERCVDWLLAAWVLAVGAAFAAAPLVGSVWSVVAEPNTIGRYVYVVVVTICLVGAALRVMRALRVRT